MTLLKLTTEGTDLVYINTEEVAAIREDGLGSIVYLKNVAQPITVEESASEILERLDHTIINMDDFLATDESEKL